MNTIIFSTNKYFTNEIKDFLSLYGDSFYYAKTNKEVIQLLNKLPIDFVIIDTAMYKEFKLIEYINENYKDTKIILTMSKELVDIVSTIKNGKYDLLSQPFRLSDLRKEFEKKDKNNLKKSF